MTVIYQTRVSPFTIRCQKCGGQYDPRVQAAACHAKVRHYPIAQVAYWQPPPNAAGDRPRYKPKWREGTPPQGDFRTLWNGPV
jgi:hypothetical protein